MTAEPPPPTPREAPAAPPGTTSTIESKSNANVIAPSDASSLAEMWARVMEAIDAVPSVSVVAESMRPVERKGSTLRLAKPTTGVRFSEVQREKLEEVVESVFGARMRVEVVEESGRAASEEAPVEANEREVDSAAREEAMRHPAVKKAAELLGGRLIRVERAE